MTEDPCSEAARDRLFSLFRRMIHLGSLLPDELRGDDVDVAAALEDPDARVDVSMIVDEMLVVEAEINVTLLASRAKLECDRLAAGV
jgi:hypothetical protein